MSKESDEIHGFFTAMVAAGCVIGKKTIHRAEKDAFRVLVEMYGEDYLKQVFMEEISKTSNAK